MDVIDEGRIAKKNPVVILTATAMMSITVCISVTITPG
jgi:hypothetical protein